MESSIGLQRVQTDCFFTKKEVAEYLVSKVKFTGYDTVIEPSAGSGVFLEFLYKHHDNVVSYDICPIHPDTIKEDYLKTTTNHPGKVIVIGNPPFGRQSSLARKFIKHSCKFATCIAFILPKSFKKPSMEKCFEQHFHKTFEEELPKNSFLINNKAYDVPCVFQIWEKKEICREIVGTLKEADYYKIIKKEEAGIGTIAFKRVGGNAGKFYYDNTLSLSKESHIFINVLDGKSRDLDGILWKGKDDTVGAKSISKQELITQMNNLEITSKKNLGQFYTTNYAYILQNFEIPDTVEKIIEPFAGNCDLLKFLGDSCREVVCYDLDPRKPGTILLDTLKFPPDFAGSFVLTNPPFLARNKSSDKTVFDKYGENDLYKCFIRILINSTGCVGGILILPINFFCSTRLSDKRLRQEFLEKYTIKRMNIFEEKVFDDTTCAVCSFQFCPKLPEVVSISATIYPKNEKINFTLSKGNNYTVGGEIYNLNGVGWEVCRAIGDMVPNTNIVLKCIDNNAGDTIGLKIVSDSEKMEYIDTTPGSTCRTYAAIWVSPEISIETQQALVEKFNRFLAVRRNQYNSLFLANYRESSCGFSRKRISFGLAYSIIGYLLGQ